MNRVTKVAAAVALASGLLAGCNTDLRDYEETNLPEVPVESDLKGGYWEISSVSSFATADESDLPNVYVFDGTTQKYYFDDDNYGTYTIYTSTFSEDVEQGTITFNYYGNSADLTDITEVSGSYTVTDGELVISETNLGDLNASDMASDESVKAAVAAANEASGTNGYVQILDTNNAGSKEDTGELRIKLADSTAVSEIASGKLTVDLVYQNHPETQQEADGSGDNAYVSFYASKTSNSNLHGEVAFENGVIKYRDASGSLTETEGTFELGETLKVEVNWEPEAFSFSVNGQEYGSGLAVADGTAVTYISLRLGDNGNTTNFELQGDNLVVYSSDSGEEEVVLEENFDSYSGGVDLSTVYNSSTNEAVVIIEGGDGNETTEPSDVTDNFDSYTSGTQIDVANSAYTVSGVDGTTTIASVSTDYAKSGENSLFVKDDSTEGKGVVSRAFSAGAAESGSVSTSVYIPADGYVKSTYLYLGTSESASSSKRFTEVAFGSSEIKFRNESGSQKVLAKYEQDTWVDVELAWSPAEDGTYDVSISIDGVEYTSYDDEGSAVAMKAENDTGAPTLFAVYNGDTSSKGTYTYFDDLDSELF